jgi:hypothetical protein
MNFTGNSAGTDETGFTASGGPGNGGAIHVTGPGNNNITNGTYSENRAAAEGGALWNNAGTMTVDNVTIDNNTATGTAADNGGGGAFNNGGTLNFTNSTLSNNTADGSNGGGIANEVDGTLSVMLSTVSGNSTTVNGGGINSSGGSVTLTAVTVARNEATGNGGGIATSSGTVDLRSTLVGENTSASGPNVGANGGSFTSSDFNLIEIDDDGTFPAQANDLVGTTAAPEFASLADLADNGGTTLTHRLLNGSRAFDAGDDSLTSPDQIGQPVFGARDIGAYESQVTLSLESQSSSVVVSRLFPNPANGGGNVQLELEPDVATGASFTLYEMSGKVIYTKAAVSGLNTLSTESLATGVYLLRVDSGSNSEVLRLLIR